MPEEYSQKMHPTANPKSRAGFLPFELRVESGLQSMCLRIQTILLFLKGHLAFENSFYLITLLTLSISCVCQKRKMNTGALNIRGFLSTMPSQFLIQVH